MVERLIEEHDSTHDFPFSTYIDLNELEERKMKPYMGFRQRPLIVIAWISSAVCWFKKIKLISPIEALSLDDSLQEMVLGYFGASKIKTTSMPAVYEKLII